MPIATISGTVLTVGILTRNSSRTLIHTLESLERQTFAAKHWNVLIVDHNSQDETRQLLEAFVVKRNNAFLFTRAENNLSRSRQFITESSVSKWIVFIDSDVVLPMNWLERVFETAEGLAAADSSFSGVGAPLRLSPKSLQLQELKLLARHPLGHFGTEQMQIPLRIKRARHLPTAAALFRREDILASGGFDPECGDCGEDLEIGERMTRAGRSFWIVPELEVEHIFSCETKMHWLARAFRFGRARIKVATLHWPMWRSFRLWLPLVFALSHLIAALFAFASGSLMSLALLVGLLASDFAILFFGYWLCAPVGQALRVGALAWATHHAYAWGEFSEFVLSPYLRGMRALRERNKVDREGTFDIDPPTEQSPRAASLGSLRG